MSSRKIFLVISTIVLVVYGTVVAVFTWNYFNFSKLYYQSESNFVTRIEDELMLILNSSNNLAVDLEAFTNREAIEVVVFNQEQTYFETVPFSVIKPGMLNSQVIALESKTKATVEGETFDVWFAIYRMQDQTYLNQLLAKQNMLVIIGMFFLLISLAFLHYLLLRPMNRVRDAIRKMSNYQFDSVEQGGDALNREISSLALQMNQSIKVVSRHYTELEVELQTQKERMNNIMTVSRALFHDLKSPIHQTMVENEMMQKDFKQEEALFLAQYNITRNHKLLQEVNDVLRLLRTNFELVNEDKEKVDVIDLLNGTLRMYNAWFLSKSFGLNLDAPEALVVSINRVSLVLLMHNLISNMVQYALEGSELELKVYCEKKWLVLETINESSSENIDRMKRSEQLFNVVVTNTKEHVYSSGNGLFLIRDLARLLNGKDEVLVDGQKVTIKIMLPGDVL